jgi:hypothetical protein
MPWCVEYFVWICLGVYTFDGFSRIFFFEQFDLHMDLLLSNVYSSHRANYQCVL